MLQQFNPLSTFHSSSPKSQTITWYCAPVLQSTKPPSTFIDFLPALALSHSKYCTKITFAFWLIGIQHNFPLKIPPNSPPDTVDGKECFGSGWKIKILVVLHISFRLTLWVSLYSRHAVPQPRCCVCVQPFYFCFSERKINFCFDAPEKRSSEGNNDVKIELSKISKSWTENSC